MWNGAALHARSAAGREALPTRPDHPAAGCLRRRCKSGLGLPGCGLMVTWLHHVCMPQVKKRFPDPETPLLIACNDGRTYTMDALVALDEEGYTNLTGLKVRVTPAPASSGDLLLIQTLASRLRPRRYGFFLSFSPGLKVLHGAL